MACSACFLTELRTTGPEVLGPTVFWVLPHQSLIKKMPYKLGCLQPDRLEILSQLRLLLRGLSLHQTDVKPTQHKVSDEKDYGVKIRAPHALVMTFLFRSGSLRQKLDAILKATYLHSRNLACFVFTYKSLCALQSHVQGETHQMHSFLAAFIGGILLFGENNNINSQMASLWILPEHLLPPTAHSREEGVLVPTERNRACLQQLWEEPSFTPLLAEPPSSTICT
ncbi:peroxisomal membrane protein 4 isoform X2 [Meriones unguiculatus]|uniref:peroxisomal membrane protein 4 isoform X2 n=1 Tax=Meriones unguiculatus TaxID=10047 RepID=UPI00293F42BE|nr:peroxisomal membrane protein 4 isoform X2 [Meriones unguiculatus]